MSRGISNTQPNSTLVSASVWAVIPAAGSGLRLCLATGGLPKALYSPVDGEPCLLELSIAALCSSEILTGIVVAVRSEDIAETAELLAPIRSDISLEVVAGGASRQDSVRLALQHVPTDSDLVLVHDAARPFCKVEEVRSVCQRALDTSAAILARPVASTLKRGNAENLISETVSREILWEAQTPQVFKTALLLEAYAAAARDGFVGTDDSQLVERLGQTVSLVIGSASNFKITHPDDIELARALIAQQ